MVKLILFDSMNARFSDGSVGYARDDDFYWRRRSNSEFWVRLNMAIDIKNI